MVAFARVILSLQNLPSSVVLQIQEKSLEYINGEDMTQYLQEVLNELEKNRIHN
jgi:hypothetical protein